MSPHGFIGKLFRSRDLPKLVMVLRAFYLEQPCDFLIKPYFINMMTQVGLQSPSTINELITQSIRKVKDIPLIFSLNAT